MARRVTGEHLGVFLLKVERVAELAGKQNAECLLVEPVHRVHHTRAVGVAANGVERAQQADAVIEAARLEAGQQLEAHLMIAAEPSQFALHALLEFALEHVRDVGAERLVRGPEETSAGTVARQRAALHEIHKRRGLSCGTEKAVHHTAHRGSSANAHEVLDVIAALALETIVPSGAADE